MEFISYELHHVAPDQTEIMPPHVYTHAPKQKGDSRAYLKNVGLLSLTCAWGSYSFCTTHCTYMYIQITFSKEETLIHLFHTHPHPRKNKTKKQMQCVRISELKGLNIPFICSNMNKSNEATWMCSLLWYVACTCSPLPAVLFSHSRFGHYRNAWLCGNDLRVFHWYKHINYSLMWRKKKKTFLFRH